MNRFARTATTLGSRITDLARKKADSLGKSRPEDLTEAMNAIKNKNIAPGNVFAHLDKNTDVGFELDKEAEDMSDETVNNIATMFGTDPKKKGVINNIISLGLLNAEGVEEAIEEEQLDEPSNEDVLRNRRIIWQHPEPGTVMEPPYLIVVAVEHRDVQKAKDARKDFAGLLIKHRNFKVPTNIATRLPRLR